MTQRPYPTPTSGRIPVPKSRVPKENKPKAELPERTKIQIDRENYEKRLSNAHAIKELSEKTLAFHKKLYSLEEQYKNGGPTALPDFDTAVQKLVQDTARSFHFAENGATFERNAPALILPRRVSVRTGNARGLEAAYRQHLDELVDFNAQRALKADNDYDRESATHNVEDILSKGVEGGLLAPEDADSLRGTFRSRVHEESWKTGGHSIRGGTPAFDGGQSNVRSYQAEQRTGSSDEGFDEPVAADPQTAKNQNQVLAMNESVSEGGEPVPFDWNNIAPSQDQLDELVSSDQIPGAKATREFERTEAKKRKQANGLQNTGDRFEPEYWAKKTRPEPRSMSIKSPRYPMFGNFGRFTESIGESETRGTLTRWPARFCLTCLRNLTRLSPRTTTKNIALARSKSD
jgi:hypothetical protein